eukprot:scaffold111832_cov51-Phaeocystis_antarctica.AAC.4
MPARSASLTLLLLLLLLLLPPPLLLPILLERGACEERIELVLLENVELAQLVRVKGSGCRAAHQLAERWSRGVPDQGVVTRSAGRGVPDQGGVGQGQAAERHGSWHLQRGCSWHLAPGT